MHTQSACSNTSPSWADRSSVAQNSFKTVFAWRRMNSSIGSWMVFPSHSWHLTHLEELDLFFDQHWLYNLHFTTQISWFGSLNSFSFYCWATFLKVVFKAKRRRKKMPGISLRKYSSVSSAFLSKWMVPREARRGCVLSQKIESAHGVDII